MSNRWSGGAVLNVLRQVATANAVPLINGNQTFLQWTAPNDGKLHTVECFLQKVVTSNETGGQVDVTFTLGGSTVTSPGGPPLPASHVVGTVISSLSTGWSPISIDPSSTITIRQTTALTGGASAFYGSLFAL